MTCSAWPTGWLPPEPKLSDGIDRRLLGRRLRVLESHGLEDILANAREARAVPGRKSEANEAQWLQRLHACGLLRAQRLSTVSIANSTAR